MADGKTHDKFTVGISTILPFLVFLLYLFVDYSKTIQMTLLVLVGCELQRIASPDMDCDDGWYGIHVVRMNFGNTIAFIWRCILWPYTKFVPHRHWLSHGFFIGSLVRFFYLFSLYYLFCKFLGIPTIIISQENLGYLSAIFFGYFMADCGHLWLDTISYL